MSTRDEVIEKLKSLGVEITTNTLLRYEKQELISQAKRGLLGIARRSTEYYETVVFEAYAAWALINGKYGNKAMQEDGLCPKISPEGVKSIRAEANIMQMDMQNKYSDVNKNMTDDDNLKEKYKEASAENIKDTEIRLISKYGDEHGSFLFAYVFIWYRLYIIAANELK